MNKTLFIFSSLVFSSIFFLFFWFLGRQKIIVMVLLKIDKWKSIIVFFVTEMEVAPPHKTFRSQIGDGWMHPVLTVVYMMHIPGILSEAFLKSCLNPVLKKILLISAFHGPLAE